MKHLPNSSFLQSRPARIEWARQQFFEEGRAPSGVVSDAVFESWSRCLRLHGNPDGTATFQPVTASRTQLALLKNQQLRQAWMDEVPRLDAILNTTSCTAMLTDGTGVLIGSSCVGRAHEAVMPVATRLGVNLSEDAVGTTAPGVAARTGKPVCIVAGEHFFESVKDMHCAAAPIRDIRGQIAGVLDISSERIPFAFDAAAVAGLFAGAIENRLLVAQSNEHLVIRFQVTADLIDSSMVGLVGFDTQDRISWVNGMANSLLGGLPGADARTEGTAENTFGRRCAQLAALPMNGAAPLTLPNGLLVWARAEMRSPDGRRGLIAPRYTPTAAAPNGVAAVADGRQPALPLVKPAAPTEEHFWAFHYGQPEQPETSTPRLRDAGLALIQKTLQACSGNVKEAARQLGVSRGLIYRRLRKAHSGSPRQDA